jgi:hypothetical protein
MYRERTMGLNAVNLIFIKRFQFPEPVFNEKNLVKDKWSRETDFRFLANQDKMNRKIDHFDDALVEIKNGCLLKPIKNLYIPQDNFWRPFRQDYEQLRLARRRKLSFYPFQVICNDEIGLNESKLEELIKTKIRDYKINVQARIFPPGAGTIHFALYLKLDGFDLDSINPLLDLKNILIYYRKKDMDVSSFFNSFTNSLTAKLTKKQQIRDINGFYTVVNFQGDSLPLDQQTIIPLSKILSGKSCPNEEELEAQRGKIKNRVRGRYEEDLFIISKLASILYVDSGLKKIHFKILKGRRCVRSHFINPIELAYVTDWLLQYYNDYFERILQVLYTVGADKSARAKVKKLLTTNILDLCAYSTLRYSILNVRKNLNQIPLTINVYDQACKEFNIAPKIRKTLIITEKLFEEAKKWNIQVDMMRTIYTEIKDWVDMLGDFVPSS